MLWTDCAAGRVPVGTSGLTAPLVAPSGFGLKFPLHTTVSSTSICRRAIVISVKILVYFINVNDQLLNTSYSTYSV